MKGGMKLVDSRPIATFYKVNWDTTSDPEILKICHYLLWSGNIAMFDWFTDWFPSDRHTYMSMWYMHLIYACH